jgi:hypothetical protein
LTWDITLTAQWWFLPAFSRSFPFFAPANQSQTADAAFARRLLSPESGNEWLKCLTPDQIFIRDMNKWCVERRAPIGCANMQVVALTGKNPSIHSAKSRVKPF